MRKDRSLDALAAVGNVAQFVSFAPQGGGVFAQTHSRVLGHPADHRFGDLADAASALLAASPEGRVNVRSYEPTDPRSREFVYGLQSAAEVVATAERLLGEGLHVILNETVDVSDGGVSGVVQDDLIEFAPDDTPRCVEKPGVASLPLDLGVDLLEIVYGFRPDVPAGGRTEFSVHPLPRGYRATRTLLWEREETAAEPGRAAVVWPNRFSRHLGDKLYGLLVAHLIGLRVPSTLAICRRVAPFSFGVATGGVGTWTRTCPVEQEPGLFTTTRGWTDPFALLAKEDSAGTAIASVLSQAAVPAAHSGAAAVAADGTVLIEGVAGTGDRFMLSEQAPQALPEHVLRKVGAACSSAGSVLGAVRLEWVHDGAEAWVVQLHAGAPDRMDHVLVDGEPSSWRTVEASAGLAALRREIGSLDPNEGLLLRGSFGLTSHMADLVRKAGVPARMEPSG
ncbi:hypothetical protein SAMN06297144_0541 [Sphingomonas guangdongensis]|uniref:Uncharacterized protein n=1 Tax=Sphingomonas guangdongensis TaxID=1141890 RepID=A0A285QD57_9SPHN|nr:hypothetical protein [Sphingomonas guangdongensis]SOB79424.1 hypothetical protein SAMN06297144_0541 [Sphingomonas guangdongensis]